MPTSYTPQETDRLSPESVVLFMEYAAPDSEMGAPPTLADLVAVFADDATITLDTLSALLHASEESLTREAARLTSRLAPYMRRDRAFERISRSFAAVLKIALVGAGVLTIPAGVWAAWTLSMPAAAHAWLAYGGIGAMLLSVVIFISMMSVTSVADAIEKDERRLRHLQELDAPGCHEMLCELKRSASARRWHHHVVHTQKRKFRWLDAHLVRCLAAAEQAANPAVSH